MGRKVSYGDLSLARSLISAAQDVAGDSAEVMMARSMIEFHAGEQEKSESILREIDASQLDREDEAEMHLWSAYIYLDGGKQRLARTELDEAQRIRGAWHRLFHELIWAEFQARNINNVMEAMTSMLILHWMV